ncbi:30S ribosomal protein S5 [Candidatus Kuenenbacteria bacterium HGW-Kuenenbacteria-1]|uniref:Small ribosomal subunit protein uS5 n=1 Tax=Candidatus Kuenenbacteria bacterium HGW-Kuenenbacteria-1 TaxID=2013812 RepID=A0A2N1UNC8_9BACT|nr:MAG: 30S ribosomal protein S5 [Candidatus Kuenenbacteria bacterium HGW-Kuenenbacteria-1]
MERRNTKGFEKEEKEFEQKIIDLARVTRVTAGGKRMNFRACVAIGDLKGRCGVGVAKGEDVAIAINKAVAVAKKKMIFVPITEEGSIPYEIKEKFGAAKIFLKPAKKGTGLKAGSAVRMVLELTGIKNITSRILGSGNKMNNAKAVVNALSKFN